MKIERVQEILEKLKNVNIAVYGDFCIDAYWIMNPEGSEISVETGLKAEAVSCHHYSLGGASNIIANIAALKPANIQVVGVIGDDIYGRELIRQFESMNVDTRSLVVQKENFDTYTFAKRYVNEHEQPRIDFGFYNKRSQATDKTLLKSLKLVIQQCDVVIFNQQVPGSITNKKFIREVNRLFHQFDNKIVLLDSRHYGDQFQNIFRKINDLEAAELNNVDVQPDDHILFEDIERYIQKLFTMFNKPVIVTRGERGMAVIDNDGIKAVDGIRLINKLDTVGAGDTVTSALALCLGAGIKLSEAAEFANLAAAVTVQKLYQTGTASGDEILEICENVDYIHNPELAEDYRKAQYYNHSNIEICKKFNSGHIKHAVFDHDGTISTLRQGWRIMMESMMIKAILGSQFETANNNVIDKIKIRVCEYIDNTTGIQTIIQMEGLVEMVKEFGLAAKDEILNKFGYKEIFNQALMKMVNQRMTQIKTGELDQSDFTIKGAVQFIKLLKEKGVKLALTSGTDRDDVINEAEVLGYAEFFDGGIYGAMGDISKYSKKIIIDKIMNDNQLQGEELVVFGDGPVELLECRKREGIAVGIASDEVRRFGLNVEKRSRLIKAGAHVVAADFSQYNALINMFI